MSEQHHVGLDVSVKETAICIVETIKLAPGAVRDAGAVALVRIPPRAG